MTVRQAFQRCSAWAQSLRDRRSDAVLRAEALAQAIENKDIQKMQVLLSPGLKTIFNNDIAALTPDAAFKTAFEKTGKLDATIFRKRYPYLYKNQKTTPISLAVITGFHEGVKLLVEKGAKIFEENPKVKSGYTGALGAAIFRGDAEMITLLMNHESVQNELNTKPAFRNYLLHTAASADNALSLQTIAACDADFMEKARAYDTMKASDFKLGTGISRKARTFGAG
ncbi:MAG: ankyrin repeat domain-containing protein [Alphaproteobacteria bacterium]